MKDKASDEIKALRAANGDTGNLYRAHMLAIRTEEQLLQARALFVELFKQYEASDDGRGGPFSQYNEECRAWIALWEKEEKE